MKIIKMFLLLKHTKWFSIQEEKLGTVSESRLSSSEKGDPVEVPDLGIVKFT